MQFNINILLNTFHCYAFGFISSSYNNVDNDDDDDDYDDVDDEKMLMKIMASGSNT